MNYVCGPWVRFSVSGIAVRLGTMDHGIGFKRKVNRKF